MAQNWLENDGEAIDQNTAALRWPKSGAGPLPGGKSLVHLSGKRALEQFDGCAPDQIIVASAKMVDRAFTCDIYDPVRLRSTGAIALSERQGKLHVISVRDVTGTRIWTRWDDAP